MPPFELTTRSFGRPNGFPSKLSDRVASLPLGWITPILVCPGVVWTEMSRPLESHARPFEPFVFSRNVEVVPSAAIRVMRFACVSVKIRLPSGIPIGPSVP